LTVPRRIDGVPHEKVWGSHDLSPLFPPAERKIGEIWFPAGPLLIKFLFTTENLSVQVHPADEDGLAGKTEMWHILRADAGAKIALGFREPVTRARLVEAARSGEIMTLLNWIPVRAGETYFTPAHTVHAIGAGIALCEIQQNSDITYRLYDYGRPREMHLEEGSRVADLGTHPGACELPVRSPHFHTEAAGWNGPSEYSAAEDHFLIVIEGEGEWDAGPVRAGEVWRVPAGTRATLGRVRCLRTWPPG
jgi:mannose-6-phosphate isomerase